MFLFVVVQLLSCVPLFAIPWTSAYQVSLSFTISQSCSNSCPLILRCYLTISSSLTSFSSCPQSSPASRSFPVSRLFAPGGQNTGVSASASALSMNMQGWFLLGLTGLISLQEKTSLVSLSVTNNNLTFSVFDWQFLWICHWLHQDWCFSYCHLRV